MQKVPCYLYPNRIILLADLAGFTVENRVVYARTVKIYQGVDNAIEFDIQNADQKRLELNSSPLITTISMNVMDASGKALPSSPYMVTPNPSVKGIAGTVIPASDLTGLKQQYLTYSVTALQGSSTIPLYADSQFGAVGKLEMIVGAVPQTRASVYYDEFSGEIDFMGNVRFHSSAIPCKFYEAVPTSTMNFSIKLNGFIGTIVLEATEDMTISSESWLNSPQLQTFTTTVASSATVTFNSITVGKWNYFRVTWYLPQLVSNDYGAVIPAPQTVTSITVTS